MISRKRNGEIQELVKAVNRVNRIRNRILAIAVALGMIILFSTFSIARGKMEVNYIKNLREQGTSASAYLENGQEEQLQELNNLEYVEYVGKNNVFGTWNQDDDTLLSTCEVLDQVGYEKIVKPAYDSLSGYYPRAQSEVMMSTKLLKRIGITNPKLGMEISIPIIFSSWSVNRGYELTETFVLAGIYNDYVEDSDHIPVTYFSEKYLEQKKIPKYPMNLLIKFRSSWLERDRIEQQLYNDINLNEARQQFIGNDSVGYQTFEQIAGGYGIAGLCAAIIVVSIYLLVYNIFSISLSKDIQLYGLLLSIGATTKQIRRLVMKQSLYTFLKGCLPGGIASVLIGFLGFPILFRGLFLQQTGEIRFGFVFYPSILLIVIFVLYVIMLLASTNSCRTLGRLSAIEAYKYKVADSVSHNKQKSSKGASLWKMAWYNLFVSKKKFLITMFSLFLGCETALSFAVIAKGTDTMNELLLKHDFEIGTPKETVYNYLFLNELYDLSNNSKSLLDKPFMDKVISMEGIDKNSIVQVYGTYGTFNYNEPFIQPNVAASYGSVDSNTAMTIQVVDNSYIGKLEKYNQDKALGIDINKLKNGTGILVVHQNELSEELIEEAKRTVNQPAHIYPRTDQGAGTQGVRFICSGYLDTTQKNFPQLEMSWNGDGINYVLISKKGFERLGYPKEIFRFMVNAQEGKEADVKKKLTQLIQGKNSEQADMNIYYLSSTSDEIEAKESYIYASKVVMTTLGLILLLIGIINYTNALVSNLIARRNEFSIMEKIGMTRKQLKHMLMAEGLYYCGILMACLLSIGTLFLWGLGFALKKSLNYFIFSYPIEEFSLIVVVLLFICIGFPRIIFFQIRSGAS